MEYPKTAAAVRSEGAAVVSELARCLREEGIALDAKTFRANRQAIVRLNKVLIA